MKHEKKRESERKRKTFSHFYYSTIVLIKQSAFTKINNMAVFDPNEAWKSWVAKYGNDYGITIEEKEVEAHEESCKEIDSSENNDISLRDFLSQMEWNMEKYADALEAGGVNTTEDLAQLDEARLKEFGVKRAHIR